MASLQEVSDTLAAAKLAVIAVDSKVDGVAALVVALRAEIAAGGGVVTQAQLDSLAAEASALKSGVDAVAAKLQAIV